MLRKTTVALAIALMLGGAFIAHAMLSLPKKVAEEATAAEVMAEEATAVGMSATAVGMSATSGVAATAVADMAVLTVATSVRLTGLAAAFRYRCQLGVAGNPAGRSR